jgi:orotate phosphoribosyltransferase
MHTTEKMIQAPANLLAFDAGLIYHEINSGNPVPQDEIIRWLKLVDAYWTFDYAGDPKRPHALLTSGNHSDGFVDCLRLLSYPPVSDVLARQLAVKLSEQLEELTHQSGVDWVIGSPHAGITFSYDVARHFRARHGFTEKGPNDEGKLWKRLSIEPDERVLLVEELITTMKTVKEQARAVHTTDADKSVNFVPTLGVFFNRSGSNTFGVWPIVSVVEKIITNWTPDECPLCKNGSLAIRPKQNWKQLTEH